jgi:glycine/D-amino acid oxidase-like deaminating enzyme
VRLYGQRRGEQILAATDAAPGLVWDLIERHAIACSAERTGWIEGSPWRWSAHGFGKRVASWQARGAPVELLDAADMEKRVGSRTYVAGILDRRGGMLNPLAYTRGLAHAAIKAGAAIQAPIEVVELVPEPSHWRIVTDRSPLTATHVVAATNAYTGRLLPDLRHPVITLYGVQSATVPVPHLAHILPGRPGFSDIRKRFFRWSPDSRLIIGGPGVWRPASGRALAFRWIERSLRRVFPELHDTVFEHRWYARGAAAADLLPHLYEPAPGLLAAVGFAGRGIAIGTALGRAMAERIAGRDEGALSFPISSHALPWGLAGQHDARAA